MSDNEPSGQIDEGVLDLLVKEIAEGLSPAERQVLDRSRDAATEAERLDLERAAAALSLAAALAEDGGAPAPLPAALAGRIRADAAAFFAAPRGEVIELDAHRPAPQPLPSYSAWWVAAACLLVGVIGWLRTPAPVAPQAAATAAEQRRDLIAAATAVTLPLAATTDPAGAQVSGDVVWDAATQRGYVRFVGLAPNDAAKSQYQIWIFDAARDQRYPVDGGVFDIPAGQAEVIVPIHAKIAVRTAQAFAVTVEAPGGVVVSSRERIVALAKAT